MRRDAHTQRAVEGTGLGVGGNCRRNEDHTPPRVPCIEGLYADGIGRVWRLEGREIRGAPTTSGEPAIGLPGEVPGVTRVIGCGYLPTSHSAGISPLNQQRRSST